jgi:hypothetical protein
MRHSLCIGAVALAGFLAPGLAAWAQAIHRGPPLQPWPYQVVEDALQDTDPETRQAALDWLATYGRPDQANAANAVLLARISSVSSPFDHSCCRLAAF